LIGQIVANLSRETRLELANASYLKASWAERFKRHGYIALSLPYSHSTLSLFVVLPVGESLGELERRLSAAALERIVHGLSRRDVAVSLPRFELQLHAVLNGPLQARSLVPASLLLEFFGFGENLSQADRQSVSELGEHVEHLGRAPRGWFVVFDLVCVAVVAELIWNFPQIGRQTGVYRRDAQHTS
jgi:serine protease inhibitor